MSDNVLKLEGDAANKMTRILTGERMKFTVNVHLLDGQTIRFQCDKRPQVIWSNGARALWVCAGGYQDETIMAWPEGAIMLVEENKNGT